MACSFLPKRVRIYLNLLVADVWRSTLNFGGASTCNAIQLSRDVCELGLRQFQLFNDCGESAPFKVLLMRSELQKNADGIWRSHSQLGNADSSLAACSKL